MNIWEKMKSYESEMTPKELEVYKLLQENTALFSTSTAGNIAIRFGIAQSAISRFCQKVGYEGFSDFRLDLAIASATQGTSKAPSEVPYDFTHYMTNLVNDVDQIIPESQFNLLAERIIHSTGIYVAGTSGSSVAAHLLSLRLVVFGINAHQINPGFEIETMHIIRPTDVIVLFSAQNPTHRDFLNFAADIPIKSRPYIVLVANTPHHPLRRKVNEVFILPSSVQDRYPVRLDSSMAQSIFCYMLVARIGQIIAQRNNRDQ